MPADSLETLLDSPAMRRALSTVLDRSNGGVDELRWRDVRDALSSGQWGRLIERGVLESAGAGFVLANPDRVDARLSERATTDAEGESLLGDVRWSLADKAAGVAAVVLFAGYSNPGIRDAVASVDDVVFGAVDSVLPFYAVVLLLSVVTGLYSTVLQDRLSDDEKTAAVQERMTDLKSRLDAARERGDDGEVERLEAAQREAMGDQMKLMKLQFRPMVWIMLLTIPVFLWLRWKVRAGHVAPTESGMVVPLVGALGWQDPLLGPVPLWMGWYFLCSFAARQVIRKSLGISPGPSASTDADAS